MADGMPNGREYNIPLTPELRRRVRDYHTSMGDKSAYVVKVVRDDDGYPFILVRVTDEYNRKVSCIEAVYDDYVVEMTHDDRDNETNMVQCFGDGSDVDYYYPEDDEDG